MNHPWRVCALVPTYNNPDTIRSVVEGVHAHIDTVIVVDDGSDAPARFVLDALADEGLVTLVRRTRNGGKGAAVKTGLRRAHQLGFSHALQVDADGQHDLADIPRLMEVSRNAPPALVLGAPVFDETAPRGRLEARKLTVFWTRFETGGAFITDAMCGFRVYPVAGALQAKARGNRMDFDIEIAVRMVWNGVPVVNVPTKVRYVAAADGGVSHFRLVRDNIWISWCHTRLSIQSLWRRARFGVS